MANDAHLAPLTHPSLGAVPHGFFGRRGGVSGGIYDSLNCGLGSADDPALVRVNRSRVADHLGSDSTRLLTCHQVHSAEIVVIDGPWAEGDQPKADGLVTRTPGLALGALAADCMPILFADAAAGVVGAAHAGWKGALAGIEARTVAAMETLGAQRERIVAVIGPCISQTAYEVGPEFMATCLAADASSRHFFTAPAHGARAHFDLPGFMLDRLSRLGLASAQWVGVCTYGASADYFSYRRTTHQGEADYGRQIAAITPPMR